jgi:DNA-binding transcriptional regulator GbsR (MarR family)
MGRPQRAAKLVDPVAAARRTLLEGVGEEVAASFPGITRLGGHIVAALYLADEPRTMDELSAELGRSKSNIFANLRGLEAVGIVTHHREPGARYDLYRLRGKYPDVVIGAYVTRLRQVVDDKRSLVRRSSELLGAARGPEAAALRTKLKALGGAYDRFGALFAMLPPMDGPIDLERVVAALPPGVLEALAAVLRATLAGDPS